MSSMDYQPCTWEGPDGRRCVLYLDHELMAKGYEGHLPDRPIRGRKPTASVDAHGFPAPEEVPHP